MSRAWIETHRIPALTSSDPVEWNHAWDKSIVAEIPDYLSAHATLREANEKHLYEYSLVLRTVRDEQRRLSYASASSFLLDNIEGRWMAADSSSREQHLIKGIVWTCRMSPEFEEYRAFCDEVSLPALQKEGGRGFLDLLKTFVLSHRDAGFDTIITFPSVRFDKMIRSGEQGLSKDQELFQALAKANRNIFICHFLANTQNSFSNRGETSVRIVTEPGHMSMPPSARQTKTTERGAINFCMKCCKDDQDGAQFMICSVCRRIVDRNVSYCSRQCQKEDWGHRHKAICGKALVSLEDAHKAAFGRSWSENGGGTNFQDGITEADFTYENASGVAFMVHSIGKIGPPTAPFTRSDALNRQISLLHTDASPDYFLRSTSGVFCPIVIQDIWMKSQFRSMRNEAMDSANHRAVAAIGQFMVRKYADVSGARTEFNGQDILNQLTEEYGGGVSAGVRVMDRGRAADPSGRTEIERLGEELRKLPPRSAN